MNLPGPIQTSSVVDITAFIASYASPSNVLNPSYLSQSFARIALLKTGCYVLTDSSFYLSNAGGSIHTRTSPQRRRKHPSTLSLPSIVRASSPRSTILRIQREWKDMVKSGVAFDWYHGEPVRRGNTSSHVWIGPLTFRQWYVWHFTFTGVDTRRSSSDGFQNATANPYTNGMYHGRLILPKTYPMHPPRIQLLTPNGRYAVGQDICLSVSSYHPETWQLSMWNIFSIIESLRYHMMTSNVQNEIGTIQPLMSFRQKQLYADQSRRWKLSMRIPGRQVDVRSTNNKRIARNVVCVDHCRMIREGWISDVRSQSIEKNVNTSVPIAQLTLRDDEVIDHHANKSIFSSVVKRRRKLRTSNIAVSRKNSITKTIQRHKKNVSLSEVFYMNGCKLFFSYPWVTVGLLGLLFLILNVV
jgi:ubiquitin-protein ligase